jgi:hypothetical protein
MIEKITLHFEEGDVDYNSWGDVPNEGLNDVVSATFMELLTPEEVKARFRRYRDMTDYIDWKESRRDKL